MWLMVVADQACVQRGEMKPAVGVTCRTLEVESTAWVRTEPPVRKLKFCEGH